MTKPWKEVLEEQFTPEQRATVKAFARRMARVYHRQRRRIARRRGGVLPRTVR